jgi:hypothetical protein
MAPKPKPHPLALPRRPEGQSTRGKTARNRLRRTDMFLLRYDPALITRRDGAFDRAFYVDLGYGAEPYTTLEAAMRLRRINPHLPVLGVEIDPVRVAAAQQFEDDQTFFRLGGFNLPLGSWPDGSAEKVRIVRAMNVLRQYEEVAVEPALAGLARHVLPGGLLIEGTSDPPGRLWTANILRRPWQDGDEADPGWQLEALVFSTNFRLPFAPEDFRPILPKNLIHRVTPGEAIHDFFAAWQQAANETRPYQVWGARQWFVAAAHRLAAGGYSILLQRRWLRRGYLIWRPSSVITSASVNAGESPARRIRGA